MVCRFPTSQRHVRNSRHCPPMHASSLPGEREPPHPEERECEKQPKIVDPGQSHRFGVSHHQPIIARQSPRGDRAESTRTPKPDGHAETGRSAGAQPLDCRDAGQDDPLAPAFRHSRAVKRITPLARLIAKDTASSHPDEPPAEASGADEIRCAFADHDRRRIGIAVGDPGHDRGIGNTQPGDAVHPQLSINDRHVV